MRVVPAGDDTVAEASRLLRAGELVVFPTETVYGLGARASDPAAVARVFAAKGRPENHPLIVHIAGPTELDTWAAPVPDAARTLAEAFWPGPLTLVTGHSGRVPYAVTGGRDTVALRAPAHPVARALLAGVGDGLAAPSANRFGRVSPTRAADAAEELDGAVSLILDGGTCAIGVESTIVDCVGPLRILRPGAVTAPEIEAVLGVPIGRWEGAARVGEAEAPGMLASHYSPRAAVELVEELSAAVVRAADRAGRGHRVGLLALTRHVLDDAGAVARQPPGGVIELDGGVDAESYARVLYARLREADQLGLDLVVAVPPPPEGIGVAVRDRLSRAAAGERSRGRSR